MPSLLLEIGCEELPAAACVEAEAQLPELAREHLGVEPTAVHVGPRRLVVLVDDLPERTPDAWVQGPPVALREKAAAGFARRHGVEPGALEERDGFLGVTVPGRAVADVLPERLAAIVHGLQFAKSMRWGPDLRFSRPVRWLCAKHGGATLPVAVDGVPAGASSFGHRFTGGRLEIPSADAYLETIRGAGVEPDQAERRRLIVEGLGALGEWSDPLGKLDEVVHLVERPLVLASDFDERFLRLPERVIVTAMQSHQRYFPLGGTRFAVVANGGDPEAIVPGYTAVLENRLDDAAFTFDRDVAVGIDELCARLREITFFTGAGTYADKTERLAALVGRLGGEETALQAARLAKADQAAELVREFPDLEGHIGATYARLAGYPEDVAAAVDEQYLPESAGGALPESEAGRLLAAADRIDTLNVAFGLGHRPTGSRDPYALRRAAIGLCRLATEGGLVVPRDLLEPDVRDFVEERLEQLLDVPVELVRVARASAAPDLAGVARVAEELAAAAESPELAATFEVHDRASRLAARGADGAEIDESLFEEDAERELAAALARVRVDPAEVRASLASAATLAPVLERFFEDVLVMAEDERLRANRLALLAAVRDTVGRLGDLSQLPR
ncbi:MAG TPA: glycine--tRNA ligase subunit beta [Gaiellaceae bacterium]|nr:glycine--tRNA ligase subunit beta [Gaiellaceae bacterium]